jgi:glycosyltransferase involved in cell wall biosynthesis
MASGLPVISTAVGGIPELLQSGQEGILVQPGDTDAFSKAMDLLAVNERMRIEMGKAGQLRAHANFAVERMVNAYNQFCQTAITLPAGHKGDSLCENHLRYR